MRDPWSLGSESNVKLTRMPDGAIILAAHLIGGHTGGVAPMTLVLHGVHGDVRAGGADGRLDVVFVNNMPDSALGATETQFVRLIEAASTEVPVRLLRFTLPTLARGEIAARHLHDRYLPLEALWDTRPAAVIVTGCEPRSPDLSAEPYWGELSHLLEWARERAASTVVSCLAAHAALLLFDGAQRRNLPTKCSGVYGQQVTSGHPLAAGLPDRVVMPHSRLNEVPNRTLDARGYRTVIGSDEVGWTVATKDYDGHLLMAVQGHPEYDTETLMLEFRRDVRRYLAGERETYPTMPVGYFPPAAQPLLDAFHAAADDAGRDPAAIDQFPTRELLQLLGSPWRAPAVQLYRNWLLDVRRRVGLRAGLVSS
jgi:homoserine O-succinyltransferase